MSYRGRFAPSPTGPLHFGSLVAALASWLDARAAGGEWLVRIEDVDQPRTVPGAADAILGALDALGLHWDGEVAYQSRRTGLYEAALGRLRTDARAYRCRCSRREIADSGLHGLEGAIYPGTCRHGDVGEDEPFAVRALAPDPVVVFDDRVQGRIAQEVARDVGDFVIKRRDGLHAYQLAVVVDDAQQGVSDVVRGADLLWSTPRQIVLQRWLGFDTPRYMHLPVAADRNGEKLSKQTNAAAIDVAHGVHELGRALRFLGQREVAGATPRELLDNARLSWEPERVPRRQAMKIPGPDPD